MRLEVFIFVCLLIVINSQVTLISPWPPATSYNGTQTNWTKQAETNYLAPRSFQSAIYDPRNNRLVIYGGLAANGTFLGDVWSWSFPGKRFIQIFPTGVAPQIRSHHVAAMDVANSRMLIFGGKNADGDLGDFWSLSLVGGQEKWTNLTLTGSFPSRRWGAFGGSYVGNTIGTRMFVSHGKAGFDGVVGDTWMYDMNANVWTDITGADGYQGRFVIGDDLRSPAPRFLAHSTMLGPNSLAIYGGCGAGGFGGCPSDDGWLMVFNQTGTLKAEWVPFSSPCGQPSYGGQGVPAVATTVTSTQRQTQALFFGGDGGPMGDYYHNGNVFEVYDTISKATGQGRWSRTRITQVVRNPLATPGGRTGASMVLIHPPVSNENFDFVVFFGGVDSSTTVRSDLWYLTGQSITGRRFRCIITYNTRMVHGIMMYISFGLIFPGMVFLARFGKDTFLPAIREKSPWLVFHGIANVVGAILAIPALVVGIIQVNTAHFTSVPHAYLGIIAFAIIIFNPIWGAIRPDKDSSKRAAWAYVHLWLGRLAVLLGLINIMLGILMIRAVTVIFALYIVQLVVMIFGYILLECLQNRRKGITCGEALNPSYKSEKYDY